MVGHRHRDGHVYPHHANIDRRGKFARSPSAAGENGDPISVLVRARQSGRFRKTFRTDDLQNGAENLIGIGFHARFYVIKQAWSDEEPVFMALKGKSSTVSDQFGALFLAKLDITLYALLVRGGDDG